MKVEINKEIEQEKEKYPCLKIACDGEIILFISPKEGIVINNKANRIGEYCNHWVESLFTPFNGSITLRND